MKIGNSYGCLVAFLSWLLFFIWLHELLRFLVAKH